MDERLKQRLVGATVLVSIAVIVVPMILERGGEPPAEIERAPPPAKPVGGFSSRIIPLEEPRTSAGNDAASERLDPKSPSAKTGETARHTSPASPQPAPPAGIRAAAPNEALADKPKPSVRSIEVQPARPAADAAQVPGSSSPQRADLTAWAVQLGSFSEAKNAMGLRDRLRAAGYTAFVESGPSDKGTVTRVFVGPELQRGEAERLLKKLKLELNFKDGLVVRYPGG